VTEPADLETPRYPVRLVALRTGLSPHVLRAWERRYGVVAPTRSEGGQRLYSELDVERLRRLRRLSGRGHAISQIASLDLEQLARLDEETAAEAASPPAPTSRTAGETPGPEADEHIRELTLAALRAVREFAPRELDALLQRAVVTLGVPAFLDRVAAPLLDLAGLGGAGAEVPRHPREQLLRIDRLDQIVIGACLQSFNSSFFTCTGGDQDDGNSSSTLLRAEGF